MNMKKRNKTIFWILLSLAIVAAALTGYFLYDKWISSRTYTASGHPEWPPIMWKDGEDIIGIGPDLIKIISSDLGLKIQTRYAGLWDMVQAKAKSGEVDVLVAAYKTSEREGYMLYSEPYTIDPIALFVKKGQVFKYDKWEDLMNKKGIATVGDSYGQAFDDFLKAKLNVTRVDTVDQALTALQKEQADYFVYALYSGEKALRQNKLTGKIQILPKYVSSENFYITISKKSPLARYLPQINQLIEKYKQDGTIEALIQKYRTSQAVVKF